MLCLSQFRAEPRPKGATCSTHSNHLPCIGITTRQHRSPIQMKATLIFLSLGFLCLLVGFFVVFFLVVVFFWFFVIVSFQLIQCATQSGIPTPWLWQERDPMDRTTCFGSIVLLYRLKMTETILWA